MKIEVEKRQKNGSDIIIFETEDWDVVRILDKKDKIVERFQHTK